MNRILTNTELEEGRVRYRVRIESDDCDIHSTLIEPIKHMLMQNIANDPSILTCGKVPFQTMKMYHDTNRWIIEAEAIVEPPNAKELRNSP